MTAPSAWHQDAHWRSDDPGEPSTGLPRIAIDPWEARLLTELAIGKRVIEIGTGLGVSTRALAASAFEVVTVDCDPWVATTIAPTLPGNVVFQTSVPERSAAPFDLAFIDGDHRPEAVLADLAAVFPLLRSEALVVFHDWYTVGSTIAATGGGVVPIGTRYGLGLAFIEHGADA